MSFGDPESLQKKYGPLKHASISFNVPSNPINVNASFQKKDAFITFPLQPSFQVKPMETVTTTVVQGEDKVLELLHFIDVDKLIEGRAGGKIKTYSLINLKTLSQRLKLPKDQSKLINIENIKKEMVKSFGDQPNLIGQLKTKDFYTLTELKKMLSDINLDTTNRLLANLKKKHGNKIPVENIVQELELEWLPIK